MVVNESKLPFDISKVGP